MLNSRDIDVTLVSGARPKLLKETLVSFSEKLFKNFVIQTLFVNIDPFQGGPTEVAACEAICREHFSNVVTRKPDAPHFTRGVKWLWSQPESEWCFHLEDDWVLSREVHFEEFQDATNRKVTQISLMTREKNWGYKSRYHFEPNRINIFGIDFGKGLNKKRPIFTTSPSFIRSDFALRCSELMDEDLDPEKQLNFLNPELNNYTTQFRNYFIGARRNYVAIDTGRRYRNEEGLVKSVNDGKSVWLKSE